MGLSIFFRRYRLASVLFVLTLFTTVSCSVDLRFGEIKLLNSINPIESAQASVTQKVRKTILDNGLTVLTKEVRTAPVVTAQVWYRVGSRDEGEGENGIAHQLEHMLFMGTKERPINFSHLFNGLGGYSNAFTYYDQTVYINTIERDKLQALLTLEADRMQNALISAEKLETEKQVVVSELQGVENRPKYRLNRALMRAAFPNSPYGLTVGGTRADVEKFTVEQVENFYRKHYRPDNATLIIVGDFQTEPTLEEITKLFGKIPKGKNSITTQNQKPQQVRAIRGNAQSPIILKEPGSLPILQAVYPLPNIKHPDVPALELLDIILTGGRSGRFYKPLLESGIASSIDGEPITMMSQGWYELSVTPTPGQRLTKINEIIQQTIAQLSKEGVTEEELKRAKKLLRANLLLEKRDINKQAEVLGFDITTAGDYKFTEGFLSNLERVTTADVQGVVKKYFDPNKLTLGFFEPTRPDPKASANSQPINKTDNSRTTEQLSPATPINPAEVAKYLPPISNTTTFNTTTSNTIEGTNQTLPEKIVLPNGLRILLLPDSSTPTVSLSGYIEAGNKFDIKGKAGLASLTATNLKSGTKTKDALRISKTLQEGAITLDFSSISEGVKIKGISLAEELPTMVETLADLVQNATFPNKELELSRQQELSFLKVVMSSPESLGRRVFQQTIYPQNHPLSNLPTSDSLTSIQRQDLLNFYKTYYRPDTTVLALVGDFKPDRVKRLFEQKFGNWKQDGKLPGVTLSNIPLPEKVTRKNLDLLGISQSITYMGYVSIARKDPRFYAAQVLNHIVGGDTITSRLGAEIRDRQGLTYGIYSSFNAGKNPGAFVIDMQTNPENVQKAIDSTLKILEQVCEGGVTENEIETAKRSLTSSYAVSLANPDVLSARILSNEVLGLSPAQLREYSEKIEVVTPTQVNRAAKELLHPDKVAIITAGPPRNQTKK